MKVLKLFGGVEAGGTKFVCGIGSGGGELLSRCEIKTTTPEETLGRVIDFFESETRVTALGVGSFGPLELDSRKENFGSILETTKEGWSNVNVPNILAEALRLPTKVSTDTDVSAIGEQYFGKAVGIKNFVYVTVGTGIGGSIVINEKLVHGISHPEIGHVRVPNDLNMMNSDSSCTYHGDCLEGLASGKALELRHGKKAELIEDPEVWSAEAKYIANGLVSVISTVQPEIIIIGGSVLKHKGLINTVRSATNDCINGYFELPKLEEYIVHNSSDSIGVLGAVKLGSMIQE